MTLSRRLTKVIAAMLAVAALGFAVWVLVELGRHFRLPQYVMPWWVLVVAALCAGLIAWGGALALSSRRPLLPWLTVLTTLLFGLAVLAMLSIGIFVLPVATASLALRLWVGRRAAGADPPLRVAPGLPLSVGLSVVALFGLAGGPVVECIQGGSASNVPAWTWWLGPGGGSGSYSGGASSSGNVEAGQVTIGSTSYSYTCAGDRLIRFTSG